MALAFNLTNYAPRFMALEAAVCKLIDPHSNPPTAKPTGATWEARIKDLEMEAKIAVDAAILDDPVLAALEALRVEIAALRAEVAAGGSGSPPADTTLDSPDGTEVGPGAVLTVLGVHYLINTRAEVYVNDKTSQGSGNVSKLRRVGNIVAQFADWGTAHGWFTVPPDGSQGVLISADDPTATPAPPVPTPVPGGKLRFSPFESPPKPIYPEIWVAPGENPARVTVRLEKPATAPAIYYSWVDNGNGMFKFYQFGESSSQIIFLPGETEKTYDVQLLTDMHTGMDFRTGVGGSTMYPTGGNTETRVRGADVKPAVAPNPYPAPIYRTPTLAHGRALAYSTDFLGEITAGPEAGKLCSREAWGNWRNGELGGYCHKDADPGTNPHPIITEGGKQRRALRAEHVPTKAMIGQERILPRDFSASEITTENTYRFPNRGAIRMVVKFDRRQGTTPALWLVGLGPDGEYFEIDILELGVGGGLGEVANFASTIHGWFGSEGWSFPIDLNDGKFHEIWFEETAEEHVTLLDGVAVSRRRNPYPDRPALQFIADVSVGGITDPPVNVGPGWRSEMIIDVIEFYEG